MISVNTQFTKPTNNQILSWTNLGGSGANNGDGRIQWIDLPLVQSGRVILNEVWPGFPTLGFKDVVLTTAYSNATYSISLVPYVDCDATITNIPRINTRIPNNQKTTGFRIFGDLNSTIIWTTNP